MVYRKTNKVERREEILRLIEELGVWNVSKAALAEKYGVNRGTIYDDINHIIETCRIENIDEIQVSLSLAYKKSIKEMMKILANSESLPADKTKAAAVMGKLGAEFTVMLENYNLKTAVRGEVVNVNVNSSIEEWERRLSKKIGVGKSEK